MALVSIPWVPTKEVAEGMMAATAQYAGKIDLLFMCTISGNGCALSIDFTILTTLLHCFLSTI